MWSAPTVAVWVGLDLSALLCALNRLFWVLPNVARYANNADSSPSVRLSRKPNLLRHTDDLMSQRSDARAAAVP